MKTPVHWNGKRSSTKALLARLSIETCEERNMILDSARAYSNKMMIFEIDRARNSG